MQEATYHIISGANLLDNYKVHYHFDPVGGGSEMYIPSSGDSLYSGRVINWNNGTPFEATADDLFKADLGTGTFSGGADDFYNQVTIEHSNDLFSGEFSFLIGAQTTSRQDVGIAEGNAAEASEKGPLTNSNILFSNMGGAGSSYSGWQLGINAANRAYVECNHDFQPLITTYMGQQNPYPHNIWGLVYREGLLKLGLYDINTENFSFETVATNTANLQSTRPWIIGSGINYDPNAIFGPSITANSGAFAGKMDNFVYFNTGLTDDLLGTVAQSIYSELAEITQPIYDTGDPGLLLGQLTGSGISGEVGVETLCSVTGYLTENVGFTEKAEMWGSPSIGDHYYLAVAERHHPISGSVTNYRALYYTGQPIPVAPGTIVTGFTTTSHTTGYLTPLIGCSGSGITGAFITGSGTAGSGISGFTGLLVSGVSGLSGAAPGVLKPNAFSYIGTPLQNEGVIEKYNLGSFGIGEKGTFNNLANLGEATLTDGYAFYLKEAANSGSLGLYLNGVGRELGGITLRSSETSRVFFDTTLNKTFAQLPDGQLLDKDEATAQQISEFFNNYNIISGDYYISGRQILEDLPLPFSNPNILNIYDTGLNTGTVRGRTEVSNVYFDYTDKLEHPIGEWSTGVADSSYYYIYATEFGLPSGANEPPPTCWKSGASVLISDLDGGTWLGSGELIEILPYGWYEMSLTYRVSKIYSPPTPDFNMTVYLNPPGGESAGLGPTCFSEISGDQWIFFNGQKLVSGINYIYDTTDHGPSGQGAGFIPSGYITGITGTYFTIPPPSGTTEVTGTSLSFGGTPFFPNSNVIFINGIREDLSASYVEHSNTKDLISGKETLRNYGTNLYNNYS